MARELEARIAEVLDSTSIAINIGEDEGVQEESTVIVWRTVEVRDPDSAKPILGSVSLESLRLKISGVYQHFSIARVEPKGIDMFGGIFKPSKVIVSSERGLSQDQVRLSRGDAVTVIVPDPPYEVVDDDDDSGSDAQQ